MEVRNEAGELIGHCRVTLGWAADSVRVYEPPRVLCGVPCDPVIRTATFPLRTFHDGPHSWRAVIADGTAPVEWLPGWVPLGLVL